MKSLGNFPDPFIAEIAGQPDAVRRAAAAAEDEAETLRAIGERARGGTLLFTGMGSSYHAAYPAVTELASRGIRTAMLDAAELRHFRLPIVESADVVVLVSQSGESAETVAVAYALHERERPPLTVAVTNVGTSTLAGLSEVVLETRAGEETGPSTMTFAAALVFLAALARATAEPAATIAREADEAATSIDRLMTDPSLADRIVAWHGGRATTVIVGRGGARAAAEMGALTLKEAVGAAAESFQAAQFRHGPLELAGPDLAAIVVATEPSTAVLDVGLATDLAALEAAVLVIGSAVADVGLAIELGPLDRLLAPAVAIVPIQLLAWRLAAAAGRTPGAYVHARKVTTRE